MLLENVNPHGGDVYRHPVSLDFSANINPFGMPDQVKSVLLSAMEHCTRYPDPCCLELREKLSVRECLPKEWILCGNGAAELIYSFAFSLPKEKPVLIPSPTFSEYETALNAAEIQTERYLLKEENAFMLDEAILQTDLSRYGAVILCTPNNPTGKTVSPKLLDAIAGTGVRMLVDMCFLELTDAPNRYDLVDWIPRHPNVVALKAFTKTFAIPGLRLGYVMGSDREFLKLMSEKTSCWNVSVLSQEAGLAALNCEDWLAQTVRSLSSERGRVLKEMRQMNLRVFESEANYLLLKTDIPLYDELLKRGILIRDCSNYAGLTKGYFRIAIRKAEENDRLLSAVKEVIW